MRPPELLLAITVYGGAVYTFDELCGVPALPSSQSSRAPFVGTLLNGVWCSFSLISLAAERKPPMDAQAETVPTLARVGAQSLHFTFCALRIVMIEQRSVVFPTLAP